MLEKERIIDDLKVIKEKWDEVNNLINVVLQEDERYADVILKSYPFENPFYSYILPLKNWINDLERESLNRIEVELLYSPDGERTFIMENEYEDGVIKEIRCVGWYFGEPDPKEIPKHKGKLNVDFM